MVTFTDNTAYLSMRRFISHVSILFLFFLHQGVSAQNVPDSLVNKLARAYNDSVKTFTLLQMGESIEAVAPANSMEFYQQALEIARRSKNNGNVFLTWINIGNCYIETNKMDSAIAGFDSSIAVARILKDSLLVARGIANMGNVYLHKNDRVKSLELYLLAAKMIELGNSPILPILYSNINALLEEQQEHTRALEFANKAVALAIKNRDTTSLVDAYINMSVSYNQLKQYDTAFHLLEKALLLANTKADLYQLVTIYNNMGDYFRVKNDFPAAEVKYLEMYRYSKQMGNQYFLSSAALVLAKVNYELKNQQTALKYILESEQLANAIGERAELKDIYEVRAQIEEAAGNFKLASSYYSKTLDLSDSLFKAETSEKVAEVEARYQNEKKQQDIIQLEKDKAIHLLTIKHKTTLNYFLLASVVVLLILALMIYRYFINGQQLAKQQDELQQIHISQLEKDKQLVVVDSMLKGQEEERTRLAKDLHDGLGGLLSGIKFSLSNMKDNLIVTPDNMSVFERSLDMIDTAIKELRRVAHNMMPEMLTKFGLDEALNEYCNAINATKLLSVKYQSHGMASRIDQSAEIIIYRIIQELLNNVLKHSAATEVFVQLVRDNSRLSVVVEDNGKGFSVHQPSGNTGVGLSNIRSRVDYLKGQLDVHSAPDKGTLINMEFKV